MVKAAAMKSKIQCVPILFRFFFEFSAFQKKINYCKVEKNAWRLQSLMTTFRIREAKVQEFLISMAKNREEFMVFFKKFYSKQGKEGSKRQKSLLLLEKCATPFDGIVCFSTSKSLIKYIKVKSLEDAQQT